MRGKYEEAITLLEMMVAVLIIGVLAAILLPNLTPQKNVAQDSTTEMVASSASMVAKIAVSAAQREGMKRLVSFDDMGIPESTPDMHIGLVQDFDTYGLRRYCILAYSDKGGTYTKATPLVIYGGEKRDSCPVDTSGAIWR